jgi:hypothetical protein
LRLLLAMPAVAHINPDRIGAMACPAARPQPDADTELTAIRRARHARKSGPVGDALTAH